MVFYTMLKLSHIVKYLVVDLRISIIVVKGRRAGPY